MKVIAVDFDGTLCDEEWPKIGKPRWPVIHELNRRQRQGDRLILWTCREGELLEQAVLWCRDHGIRFDAINGNVPERIEQYGDDTRKVSADEYWDDRAVLVKESGRSESEAVLLWAQPQAVLCQQLLEGTSPTGAERQEGAAEADPKDDRRKQDMKQAEKTGQEPELLGKTIEEETFSEAVNELCEELLTLIAPIVEVPLEILSGRKPPASQKPGGAAEADLKNDSGRNGI